MVGTCFFPFCPDVQDQSPVFTCTNARSSRHTAEHIATALTQRFGFVCHWQGDCLAFKRTGVAGTITLAPGQVQVAAQLGFPFSLMQAQVEAEIQRVLKEKF